MQGILYEEPSVLYFVLITIIMGMDGVAHGKECCRRLEQLWGPGVLYATSGVAIRFIHHALFNGSMLTLQYYVVDTIILLLFATAGYRYYRTQQMTNNYYWLYEKVSPFSWKSK